VQGNTNSLRWNETSGNGYATGPATNFGIGLLATAFNNLIEANSAIGNSNGIVVFPGAANNQIRQRADRRGHGHLGSVSARHELLPRQHVRDRCQRPVPDDRHASSAEKAGKLIAQRRTSAQRDAVRILCGVAVREKVSFAKTSSGATSSLTLERIEAVERTSLSTRN